MLKIQNTSLGNRKSIVLVLFIAVSLFSCLAEAKVKNRKPLVWDMQRLAELKEDMAVSKDTKKILERADEYSGLKPITLVDNKKLTFEPDIHYYCSIGPYWWPDPSKNGQYTRRDGKVNPESKLYDNVRLTDMIDRCTVLSKAYFLTKNKKYYKAFISQLRAWFIAEDTRMYPNFEYSQVIPGKNNNKGRSAGMITAYGFNTVIESIRLVNGVKRIDYKTVKELKKWFSDFAEWADKGEFCYGLKSSNDNIGLAYDVTLVNMFLFIGYEDRAKEIADDFLNKRINIQINENGTQPVELKRTRAFSYSVYNLTHIIDFCYLVRCWYPNYYHENCERIDSAFDYLGHYISDNESFPYSQTTSWKDCIKDYYEQLQRLQNL